MSCHVTLWSKACARVGEIVSTVAPAARNALRTVARSLAAPQADVVAVVVVAVAVVADVDKGVVVFVRIFWTNADSRICLSFADKLLQRVGKDRSRPCPYPWLWPLLCVVVGVDGDDEVTFFPFLVVFDGFCGDK